MKKLDFHGGDNFLGSRSGNNTGDPKRKNSRDRKGGRAEFKFERKKKSRFGKWESEHGDVFVKKSKSNFPSDRVAKKAFHPVGG